MAFSSTYTRKQQEHSPKYYCRKPELSELRTRKFGWACGREQRSLKESEGPRLVPLPTLEFQNTLSALLERLPQRNVLEKLQELSGNGWIRGFDAP